MRPNYFVFIEYLKKKRWEGGGEGWWRGAGSSEPPESPLDLPLESVHANLVLIAFACLFCGYVSIMFPYNLINLTIILTLFS